MAGAAKRSAARSMTGYGAGTAAGSRIAVAVEARSVNGRSLKITIRSPAILAPRESAIESLLRTRLRRGTLTVYVRIDLLRPQDTVRIRPGVVEGLARSLEPLRKQGLIDGALTPDGLAAIPGALEVGPADALRSADWRVVKSAVLNAVDELNGMREREALHLVRDLKSILVRMRKTLGAVRKRSPQVVNEHRNKLRERLDALLGDVRMDEATLAREVAVLADRSDITEETTRLVAHLDEFGKYLGNGGEMGRTLDFLSQEILREVNTIGSKSGDVAITKSVIALKSDVDRLKEQVANLE